MAESTELDQKRGTPRKQNNSKPLQGKLGTTSTIISTGITWLSVSCKTASVCVSTDADPDRETSYAPSLMINPHCKGDFKDPSQHISFPLMCVEFLRTSWCINHSFPV